MHGTIAVSRHTTLLHVNGTRPHRHRAQSRCRACTSEQPSQPAYQSTRDFINSLRATVHTHTPLHNTCCRKSTPSYQSQPTTPPQATATTPHTPLGRAPVRVLGVDFGTRRTGVAVSALGLAPRPLQVLDSRGPYIGLAGRILALAAQEHVNGIVVGLPVTRRGSIRRAETDSQQVVVVVVLTSMHMSTYWRWHIFVARSAWCACVWMKRMPSTGSAV